MERYVALLRGVNVGGKNPLSMSTLKEVLTQNGYQQVKTYLNSGNVLFSLDNDDLQWLSIRMKQLLKEQFGLEIEICLLKQKHLKAILQQAPVWWGTNQKEIYDNLIFILSNQKGAQLAQKIGEPTAGLEQVAVYDDFIFWSFNRKNYAKANWWEKTAIAGIGEWMTIRTANTVKKLVSM